MLMFIILINLLTSCSAGHGNASSQQPQGSQSYYEFKTITYENVKYVLYKNNDITFIDQISSKKVTGLKYYVTIFNVGTDALDYTNWTINYKLNNQHIDPLNHVDDEFIRYVYNHLETTILEYQTMFDVELEYYQDIFNIEKEFQIDMNKLSDNIHIIDVYLPIKILNESNQAVFEIYIPIKSLLAYQQINILHLLCDNNIIEVEYGQFINTEGVSK